MGLSLQKTHLVVRREHAHVERHGAHNGGGGATEQAAHAVLAHNAHKRVTHALQDVEQMSSSEQSNQRIDGRRWVESCGDAHTHGRKRAQGPSAHKKHERKHQLRPPDGQH